MAAAPEAANGARNILLVDGVWREEALAFDRAFHLFDEERSREARLTWKALATQHGIDRRYWKQDDGGRWEQAALAGVHRSATATRAARLSPQQAGARDRHGRPTYLFDPQARCQPPPPDRRARKRGG